MTEGEAAGMTACATCGASMLPAERFCEACGAEQPGTESSSDAEQSPRRQQSSGAAPGPPPAAPDPPAAPCAACGGVVADDGYCQTCGERARSPREHWREHPAPWVAGVCDRGVRHHRNEDAMALHADPTSGPAGTDGSAPTVLVVCDGVSRSVDSDAASLAAARAARDVLIEPESAGDPDAWSRRLVRAAQAAQGQVVKVAAAADPAALAELGAPSCTFVAAVVACADGGGTQIVVGNVGDSRAYWLPDAGTAVQPSTDDSWAAGQIALGMPREEAESAPRAHAITRWLGADSPDHDPRCTVLRPEGPGWLMLCSDGLWNYCSPAADIAGLMAEAAADGAGLADADPAELAAELVAWANAQGGQDNITVALVRVAETI